MADIETASQHEATSRMHISLYYKTYVDGINCEGTGYDGYCIFLFYTKHNVIELTGTRTSVEMLSK